MSATCAENQSKSVRGITPGAEWKEKIFGSLKCTLSAKKKPISMASTGKCSAKEK